MVYYLKDNNLNRSYLIGDKQEGGSFYLIDSEQVRMSMPHSDFGYFDAKEEITKDDIQFSIKNSLFGKRLLVDEIQIKDILFNDFDIPINKEETLNQMQSKIYKLFDKYLNRKIGI